MNDVYDMHDNDRKLYFKIMESTVDNPFHAIHTNKWITTDYRI